MAVDPPAPPAAPAAPSPSAAAASRRRPALPVIGGPTGTAGPAGETTAPVLRIEEDRTRRVEDRLAVEEPLEIRLAAGGAERVVAVTMRTPGHDVELATGFLFCEGVLAGRDDLRRVGDLDPGQEPPGPTGAAGCDNRLWVELAADRLPDLAPLERHFFATSACGVCGKAGLEALTVGGRGSLPVEWSVDREVLAELPARLAAAQGLFATTGGLHAAALFDLDGELVTIREDVGRHNALDKLIGRALLDRRLPLAQGMVLVSGRSSFEILQKCLAAGVPLVCSVSAPSSLAVEVARRFGITLVGFLRGARANVYSAPGRIRGAEAGAAL